MPGGDDVRLFGYVPLKVPKDNILMELPLASLTAVLITVGFVDTFTLAELGPATLNVALATGLEVLLPPPDIVYWYVTVKALPGETQ
jgi:hypothetical protein